MTVSDVRTVGQAQAIEDLARLDLAGRSVLVHSSLRRTGPFEDGAATVLSALQSVGGVQATVVVPAQTPNNSITSDAFREATRGLMGIEGRGHAADGERSEDGAGFGDRFVAQENDECRRIAVARQMAGERRRAGRELAVGTARVAMADCDGVGRPRRNRFEPREHGEVA